MLTGKIPVLAAQPGNGNGALPLEKPDDRSHCDTHMYMVWHQMPLENLAFLLFRQPMENLPQMTADSWKPTFRTAIMVGALKRWLLYFLERVPKSDGCGRFRET